VWIDNVAVIDSSSISATPTATVTFPLANTLYNVFIAYERWETAANVFCAHHSPSTLFSVPALLPRILVSKSGGAN
jgi:hypothetical protein